MIGKGELKQLLFLGNMIAYIKQADLYTIRTMKYFRRVVGYEINIANSIMFVYFSNKEHILYSPSGVTLAVPGCNNGGLDA